MADNGRLLNPPAQNPTQQPQGEGWPRGPRTLILRRCDHGFGFTLRHFIVYPPESYTLGGGGARAMDTIFVKHVHADSPAAHAGLVPGDRVVSVNGENITGHSYAHVVQLIQGSGAALRLAVVPKEHDILQLYFGETAHNPETNQRPSRLRSPEVLSMQKVSAIPARIQQSKHKSAKHRQSLDNARPMSDKLRQSPEKCRKSLDNARPTSDNADPEWQRPIGSENRGTARYRNPSRRASEGNNVKRDAVYGNSYYPDNFLWTQLGASRDKEMLQGRVPVHHASDSETSSSASSLHGLCYSGEGSRRDSGASLPSRDGMRDSSGSTPTRDGMRDSSGSTPTRDGMRDSSGSLPSRENLTDSKDSLSSFGSTSTLTGHDQSSDDSLIMSRIRKSFEQKEEFLRRPAPPPPADLPLIAREFYARPQKLRPVWPPGGSPPPAPAAAAGGARRGRSPAQGEGPHFECGGPVTVNHTQDPRSTARSQQRSFVTTLSRIQENLASASYNGDEDCCSSLPASPNAESYTRSLSSPTEDQDRYPEHNSLIQLVSRRARQFESGRLEAGGVDGDRTSLYRSELSRLTSKRSVPNVALRKREIEARSGGRATRESRSVETNNGSEEIVGLSRSWATPIGSKELHCRPTVEVDHPTASAPGVSIDDVNGHRARSNSAESWAAAFGTMATRGSVRNTLDWPLHDESNRHKAVRQDSYLAAVGTESRPAAHVSGTEDCPTPPPPARPTQLSISPPTAPTPAPAIAHTDTAQLMEALDNAQLEAAANANDMITTTVVRRQKNPHHNILDDDRLRRASYLKATNSDRMHVDSDHEYSDSEQQTRSANRKWRPPMFPDDIQQLREFFEEGARPPAPARNNAAVVPTASPDDKENQTAVKEGWLHCKITIVDGKRASDRSWKQVWASLSDRTLYLYKERPTQTPLSDNEATAVDVGAAQVDAAGGYTKKKNVLRLNTLSCSELLLQADDGADMNRWMLALQEQAQIKQDVDCTSGRAGNAGVSPLPNKGLRKLTSFRNRSPTGQSPVSKTLKPCQSEPLASPKTKTWKGRVARQFRRIQHAGSPSSPTAPDPSGATIGIPLEDCPPAEGNEMLPWLVAKCAAIVEERGGLDIIGIYRVPGNTAAVSSLTEAVNKGFQFISYQDPRWSDVNVISSLLKLFFRRLPDALLTSDLYPHFIAADKMDDPNGRLARMRHLVRELPDAHFETLKYLMRHLKKVVQHSAVNKMEARNLAIVFGPTLVRTADNNMVTMVTDMSHQCRIVESLILYVDWFFSDEDKDDDGSFPFALQPDGTGELEASAMNHDLLLSNIQKVEGMRSESSGKDILSKVIGSSIISAANRKMQKAKSRKGAGHHHHHNNNNVAVVAEGAPKGIVADNDAKKMKDATQTCGESALASSILDSVMLTGGIVKSLRTDDDDDVATNQEAASPESTNQGEAFEDGTIRTYAGLSATTQERIRKFELETKAMLQRDLTRQRRDPDEMSTAQRRGAESEAATDKPADHTTDTASSSTLEHSSARITSSTSTTTRTSFLSDTVEQHRPSLDQTSLPTHTTLSTRSSSSTRTTLPMPTSLPAHTTLSTPTTLSTQTSLPAHTTLSSRTSLPADLGPRTILHRVSVETSAPTNIHANPMADGQMMSRLSKKHFFSTAGEEVAAVRRVGSVENVAQGELVRKGSNGTLKRFKTGKEQLAQPSLLMSSLRCGSLDSLQEAFADRTPSDMSDDGGDLLSSLTSTFDRKLKSLLSTATEPLAATVVPPTATREVDSPSASPRPARASRIPTYRDPSLHRAMSNSRIQPQEVSVVPKEDKELIRRRWIEEGSVPSVSESPFLRGNPTEADGTRRPVMYKGTIARLQAPETKKVDAKEVAKPDVDESRLVEDVIVPTKVTGEEVAGDSKGTTEQGVVVKEEVVLRRANRRTETLVAVAKVDSEEIAETTKKVEELNSDSVVTRRDSRRPESLGPSTKENTNLKRSESLTKADKELRRSESLTKDESSTKLKRSDSLTKTEKTESNISKRRQQESGKERRSKEKENFVVSKLKRKNGMPDRSIKRRHTVGGTKDFDKVNWLDNRLQTEQLDAVATSQKERRCLRTSSPDLSSSRLSGMRGREGFLVEIRSRQGGRPQSLADARAFKVPLESHV